MIVVVGATGYLGSAVARMLRGQGREVRGTVRPTSDGEQVEALRAAGVELVTADLKDAASLAAACEGAETVVSTATITRSRQDGDSIETVDHEGQLALVDAAARAGVRHFVYVSYLDDIDRDEPSPLTVAKRSVEERLRQSGMTYTIVQPGCFMEMWLSPALGFDYPNARAQVYGSGEAPLGWVSLGDVAQVVVRCVDDPAARDAVVPVVGEWLSQNGAIRVFEEIGGRRFVLNVIPESALLAQRETAPDSLSRSFAGLMLSVARGNGPEAPGTPLPMRMMTVREYAERVAQPATA